LWALRTPPTRLTSWALYETHNHVDTVVVYGPDLNGAGELIVEALRGICNNAPRIPCEYVKTLNVDLVDLRWRGEELRKAVETRYRPAREAARPRREVALEKPNKRLPHGGLHILYDDDLEALRVRAIDYIATYGAESRDVLYSHLALQRRPGGKYLARPCDVFEEWPCGLDEADVLLATPAYIHKSRLEVAMSAIIRLEVYSRDVYDSHGNFVLADMLYHYGPRGVLLRQIELDEVNVRREAQKLLPDHAFYIGREYATYKLLKDKYVQDRWKQ
jgi:hypothetical protein